MRDDHRVPVVWVLLASVLFGTTGTARQLGLPDADPLTVGALRLAVGGLLLGLVAAPRILRLRGRGRPTGRVALLLVVGAAGVVAYQPTFFAGVGANGVPVGTLVALGSAPVFTGLLAWLLQRRRPSGRWFACTAVAVAGVVLLSGLLDGPGASVSVAGLLASLGAGIAYAVYTLAVKGLLDRGWDTAASVGAVFGLAGVISLVELPLIGGGLPTGAAALPAVAWLGVMTVTAAYLLFAKGLQRMPAATVATITLAEPVTAAVLGVLLLGATMSPQALVGAGLLVVALALLGLPGRRRRDRAAVPTGPAASSTSR